jgi:hypothetical protein
MKTCGTCFFLCVGWLLSCYNRLSKRGWQHLTSFVMVLLDYRVESSRVKAQGLFFIGCLAMVLLKVLFWKFRLSSG